MRLPIHRRLLALSAAAGVLACGTPALAQPDMPGDQARFCSQPVIQPVPGEPMPPPEELCGGYDLQAVPPLPSGDAVAPMPMPMPMHGPMAMPMPMPMPAPHAAYAAPAYAAPYPGGPEYGVPYPGYGNAYPAPADFDRDDWLRDCRARHHAERHRADRCEADLDRHHHGGYGHGPIEGYGYGYGYGYRYPAYGYAGYTWVPVVVAIPQRQVVKETVTEELVREPVRARRIAHPRPAPRPAPRPSKLIKAN